MALEAEELELPDFLNNSSEEEIHEKMLSNLPEDIDIVVTHESLTDRAKAVRPNAVHYSVSNFLEGEQYDAIIEKIRETRQG